jgi:hypothetical protein
MTSFDNMPNPIIKKVENNEILWENENNSDIINDDKDEKINFFDDWYNNYFIKDIKLFEKEKKNLSISEFINNILNNQFYLLNKLKKYFEEYHLRKISEKFNEIVIINNIEKISDYFYDMNRTELKKFYEENKKYKNCLYLIYQSMKHSIDKKGLKILENKGIVIDENNRNIFPLIEMKKEIERLFLECFGKEDPKYEDYLDSICKISLNVKPYAKKLAYYINECMQNKFKGKTEKEIDKELNLIIEVFKLLINKIDFKILNEKLMSERLIKNAYSSLYAEKNFIIKIKKVAGYNYIYIMSQIISDIDKSNNEIEQYNKLKSKSLPNDLKFKSIIISQNIWQNDPNQNIIKINLPPLLSSFANDFENIYKQRHQSHSKLFWLHKISTVNIKYLCFKNKNYESQTTLLQYLILLEIEKNEILSLKKIAENIGCEINLILKEISGLIFNKSFNPNLERDKGLLLGNFNEKEEFKETDEVCFNFDFNYEHLRFKTIPMNIKKSESEIKKEQDNEKLIIQRMHDNIIQATLTRIMKSQHGKKVQHSWLVNEVSEQITEFKAQPHQIKLNIEKIIEKNVIKRDEDDGSCYMYIA